jgi:type II secretory pathway pseudopilin PulG
MNSLCTTHTVLRRQRGAAFIVMLVILIVGTVAFLVSSLSSSAIATARNATTADALAQAKDALIGRAASDITVPGSLPCPDTHAPGSSLEGTADFGTPCPNGYIGRLPWKTLGLPDIRDGSGERLWYALSFNYRDVTSTTVNSDTLGTISIFASDGTLLNDGTSTGAGANGAVAVIIAPGNVITRQGGTLQDRSSTGFTTPSNYLDVATIGGNTLNNSVFTGSSTATTGFIQGPVKDNSGNIIVNDQILVISRDQLMPVVETRIAREVKKCLDDYAADPSNTNHRYPWAALVSALNPSHTGTYQVLFGWIGDIPSIDTSSPGTPPIGTLLTYIQYVQTALTNYVNTPNASNLNALNNAGDTLKDFTVSGSPAHTAGVTADGCTGTSCTTTLQNQLNTAMGGASVDSTMFASWPPTCTIFSSTYWNDWRDLVFYQVADGFQPQSTTTPTSCTPTTTCLTISGSGSYRAAVLVSRKMLTGQTRPSYANPPDNYLEANGTISNSHQSAINATPAPSVNFITYSPSNNNFSMVNDLALCLDGNGINPASVCK